MPTDAYRCLQVPTENRCEILSLTNANRVFWGEYLARGAPFRSKTLSTMPKPTAEGALPFAPDRPSTCAGEAFLPVGCIGQRESSHNGKIDKPLPSLRHMKCRPTGAVDFAIPMGNAHEGVYGFLS